jgi:hypothetical protein
MKRVDGQVALACLYYIRYTLLEPLNRELREYQTREGKNPFKEWLSSIRDKEVKARIIVRLKRLAFGHYGIVGGSAMEYWNFASMLAQATESILQKMDALLFFYSMVAIRKPNRKISKGQKDIGKITEEDNEKKCSFS